MHAWCPVEPILQFKSIFPRIKKKEKKKENFDGEVHGQIWDSAITVTSAHL